MTHVIVVIGAGSIGQAIARRASAGKHVLLADLKKENADAAAKVLLDAGFEVSTAECEGEAIVEIRAGDVIWCPPGHKHWHGATSTTAMTHIAIQEALDGKNVIWMEKVTDEEYLAGTN